MANDRTRRTWIPHPWATPLRKLAPVRTAYAHVRTLSHTRTHTHSQKYTHVNDHHIAHNGVVPFWHLVPHLILLLFCGGHRVYGMCFFVQWFEVVIR